MNGEPPQLEDFDIALRASLRREPAPPDFAAKVLARARTVPPRRRW